MILLSNVFFFRSFHCFSHFFTNFVMQYWYFHPPMVILNNICILICFIVYFHQLFRTYVLNYLFYLYFQSRDCRYSLIYIFMVSFSQWFILISLNNVFFFCSFHRFSHYFPFPIIFGPLFDQGDQNRQQLDTNFIMIQIFYHV